MSHFKWLMLHAMEMLIISYNHWIGQSILSHTIQDMLSFTSFQILLVYLKVSIVIKSNDIDFNHTIHYIAIWAEVEHAFFREGLCSINQTSCCRQNAELVVRHVKRHRFNRYSRSIHLENISCNGNEDNVLKCRMNTIRYNRYFNRYIIVNCQGNFLCKCAISIKKRQHTSRLWWNFYKWDRWRYSQKLVES